MKVLFGRHTAHLWLLGVISAFISLRSYSAGTWLSGWDTLHPEFDFGLNLQRLIFGVFRGEQGLGAVAAHSHMADLPRTILLAITSLFLPESSLRYLFISICLVAGTLGSFVFIKNIVLKEVKNSSAFAFLGALFYLLNLGTLQQFYVPFEMFTVQFAVLPWLFYFASKYLTEGGQKNLFKFCLTTLISTPMAFASTLWFAYFLSFCLFLAFFLKEKIKKAAVLFGATLLINSFWLLPALYFVLSGNASMVELAKVNKIFSQEAFAYNQSYGTLKDILIFRSFLLDWLAYDYNQQGFTFLMGTWRDHLAKPFVLPIGYFLSGVSLIGMAFGIFSRRRILLALFFPVVLSGIFLVNQNPPFDAFFSLLRQNLPLFKEAMRFPFTKFSLIFVFGFACFFAFGQRYLNRIFRRVSLQLVFFGFLFFIFMMPAFGGDFISKKIQVSIPKEYFEMFNWLNKQPQGRIATFPVNSFWGWTYYKWGFQGAQFISFGIKQPLLDRDYDRWNPENEEYFRQISRTVYSKDLQGLEKSLSKYRVRYLVLDRNVISPGEDKRVLFNDETQELFRASSKIALLKKFDGISVYLFKDEKETAVFAPPAFISVSENKGPLEADQVYRDFGDYFETPKNPSLFVPFRALTDNQNIFSTDFVRADNNFIKFLFGLSPEAVLPWESYLDKELSIPARAYSRKENGNLIVKLIPAIFRQTGGQDRVNLFQQVPYPAGVKNESTRSGDKEDILIGLDNNQVIPLSSEKTDFTDRGTVFLNTKSFNNMAFYLKGNEKKQEDWNIDDLMKIQSLETCSKGEGSLEVEVALLKNKGVKLSARNALACFQIPLRLVINKADLVEFKSLIRFKFRSFSEGQALGNYCIFDTSTGRCIKEQEFLPLGEVSDFVTADPVGLDTMQLRLFLNSVNGKEEITYSDISFSVNNPFALSSGSEDELYNAFSDLKLNIRQANEIRLNELSEYSGNSFDLVSHDKRAYACASVLPRKFTKNVNIKEGFIEYSSQNGSSCDYFSFPNLPHNLGYVISVNSENIEGLPLRMCLANTFTKRCDLSVALPKTSEALFLLPPSNDGGVGYNVHFDNYSVGRITSTNRIKGIKIIPFPYYWINNMQFALKAENLMQESGVKIIFSKELFPGFVFVNLENNKPNSGLIVLNQSYDKGWTATAGRHVKANGWANGWLIEGQGKQSIFVFFWPQILEFAGFVFAGATLFIIFRYRKI